MTIFTLIIIMIEIFTTGWRLKVLGSLWYAIDDPHKVESHPLKRLKNNQAKKVKPITPVICLLVIRLS